MGSLALTAVVDLEGWWRGMRTVARPVMTVLNSPSSSVPLGPFKLDCKQQSHHLPTQPGEGEPQASAEERRAQASELLNLDTLFEFH